jgi:hypothetical protein
MIKETLIALLLWVDPSVHVVPVTQLCVPAESSESIEQSNQRHRNNMSDMGKLQPGKIVDPWGALPDSRKDALEHDAGRSGGN